MLNIHKANFIGEGPRVKGAAYQIYEQDGKFYSLIVHGPDNWILEDSIEEIPKEDIGKYIIED